MRQNCFTGSCRRNGKSGARRQGATVFRSISVLLLRLLCVESRFPIVPILRNIRIQSQRVFLRRDKPGFPVWHDDFKTWLVNYLLHLRYYHLPFYLYEYQLSMQPFHSLTLSDLLALPRS
jgi:hypothetical protein